MRSIEKKKFYPEDILLHYDIIIEMSLFVLDLLFFTPLLEHFKEFINQFIKLYYYNNHHFDI